MARPPKPQQWTAKLVRQHTNYIAYLKSEGAKPNEIAAALWDWEFERGLRDKPRPILRRSPSETKKSLKGLDLESLGEWSNQQPWYVKIPMFFVLVQLTIVKLIIVMFGFGLLLYFASGAGAP